MSDLSDLNLPDDGVPTFGYRQMHLRAKRRCAACNRKVWVGIVNIANPEGPVVCRSCYDAWDEGPTIFEDATVEDL